MTLQYEHTQYRRGYRDGEDDGRQAQYELHREDNCTSLKRWDMAETGQCIHRQGGCPTDYRECPLSVDLPDNAHAEGTALCDVSQVKRKDGEG